MLKSFGLSVPLGALTATAGTPGTRCLPAFPSNELLPSLNALYVSQLPKVGVRMSPPLPRIRLFPQFGVKSINFPGNILQLTLQFSKYRKQPLQTLSKLLIPLALILVKPEVVLIFPHNFILLNLPRNAHPLSSLFFLKHTIISFLPFLNEHLLYIPAIIHVKALIISITLCSNTYLLLHSHSS